MKESLLKLTGEGINDKMKETLENANIEWFTTVERLDKNYIYTVCEQ
jgi:4'-phosphopantetheinyl transferase